MAAVRRRAQSDFIWPGFVDALSALLIVFIFLIVVFTVAQVFLAREVSSRDSAIARLSAQIETLAEELSMERRTTDELEDRVAGLSARLDATLASLRETEASEEEKGRALARAATELESVRDTLAEREALTARQVDVIARLNQQVVALRDQLASIQEALEASEETVADQKIELENLGERLNVALAKKAHELTKYRSEFFGRLRKVLGNREGIRIVGDRFVFESSVLFETASAELGAEGRKTMQSLAATLKGLAKEIPSDVDWILRIDGHTDRRPISTPEYPSNWELSNARALSVVKLLVAEGIPPGRLTAAGFGEHHPIAEGRSAAAMAKNRRIELRLTQR